MLQTYRRHCPLPVIIILRWCQGEVLQAEHGHVGPRGSSKSYRLVKFLVPGEHRHV